MNRNTRNIRKNHEVARMRQELAEITSFQDALAQFTHAMRTPLQEKEQVLAMLQQWWDGFTPGDAFDRGYALALSDAMNAIKKDWHWKKEYIK